MHPSFTSTARAVENSYDIYTPVKGVSIVFAFFFLISGILHSVYNNVKRTSYRIGFLLPWAAALFVAGYCLREYTAYHPDDLDILIASQVLLFVAPPVYAGADYCILGRLLYYIPYLSPLHPGRVWTTFVGLDCFVESLACQGASRALNPKGDPYGVRVGLDLVKASLILQMALGGAFVLLTAIFHRRCLREGIFTRNSQIIIYELYVSSLLILVRNVVRTVAFCSPSTAYVNRTEWILWVFEAVPMLANTLMMNIWCPAQYLPANKKTYLAKDGKTELEGPGVMDTRCWLLTLVDPFDVIGLCTGRDHRNRFWEEDGIGGPRLQGLVGYGAGAVEMAMPPVVQRV